MNMIHATMQDVATWIRFWVLVGYVVVAVPIEYELDDWDRELAYDFDTEQSEIRYDPKLLSEELEDTFSKRRGASCNISNILYEHGEQVARHDPCEVCVCMDGEIFCYWRQCSGEIGDSVNYDGKEEENKKGDVFSYWKSKRLSSGSNHVKISNPLTPAKLSKMKEKLLKSTKTPSTTKPTAPSRILPKPTKVIKSKKLHKAKKQSKRPRKPSRKRMKSKKVFSFPEHLPATLHFDIENANRNEFEEESDEISDESPGSGVKAKVTALMNADTSTSTTSSESIYSNKNQPQQGANNAALPQLQSAERNTSQNDPDTNGWQGFSLNISQSTITLSSPPLLPSSQQSTETLTTTASTTTTITSSATPAAGNGNNNEGSSGMPSKHINFQSGGIIPNDVSIDSEDDSDDNENDSGGAGERSPGDKKAEAEKMLASDAGLENRRIQFVDVPMAKHYIITSSGSVENADVLASENVLSQFRNDFGVVNGNPTGSVLIPPSAPEALQTPQLPPHLDSSTGEGMSETASQQKTSAAIISNDVAQSPLVTMTGASNPEAKLVFSEGAARPATAEAATAQSNATPSPTYVAGGKTSSEVSISATLQQSSIPATSLAASLEPGQQRGEPSAQQPEESSTAQSPRQQYDCVVMGSSYQVGTILPQETGNCLQCVCAEGSSSNDPPRVTCSPHNCPPLVLPDLFDTTGY